VATYGEAKPLRQNVKSAHFLPAPLRHKKKKNVRAKGLLSLDVFLEIHPRQDFALENFSQKNPADDSKAVPSPGGKERSKDRGLGSFYLKTNRKF